MAQKELVDYIKQTSAQGFDDDAIRAELKKAGWPDEEIQAGFAEIGSAEQTNSAKQPQPQAAEETVSEEYEEEYEDGPGFFARYRRALIILVIIFILLPLLVWGGLLAYQAFTDGEDTDIENSDDFPSSEENLPADDEVVIPEISEDELAADRDEERLEDIEALQTALQTYFEQNQSYPTTLGALVAADLILRIPVDPETNEVYVYTASESAPNFYSLAFILETDMGILEAGLHVASPQNLINADATIRQDEVVEGRRAQTLTEGLIVSDISRVPFYPGEEVYLDVQAPAGIALESVFITVDNLKLSDEKQPFSFTFSAPNRSGQYQINIFAFDKSGGSYFETKILTVSP